MASVRKSDPESRAKLIAYERKLQNHTVLDLIARFLYRMCIHKARKLVRPSYVLEDDELYLPGSSHCNSQDSDVLKELSVLRDEGIFEY